ncbi:MAG TPA: hypothetical protein ENK36_04560, partial [Desulfobacterales bacterium]|nr:hypothetical protein [Desulfobacterales bacterium]
CYDNTYGGDYDGFVTIINPDLSKIEYSTFLGTDKSDQIQAIAVRDLNTIILVGDTQSPDFPITPEAIKQNLGGAQDGFIVDLNVKTNELTYASFIGGSGRDSIKEIELTDENSYSLVVRTGSADFPVTENALYKNKIGGSDLVVLQLDETLENIVYSTYLGGSKHEYMVGTSSNGSDDLILTFTSNSEDFPATIKYADKDSTNMNTLVKFDMNRKSITLDNSLNQQDKLKASMSQIDLEKSIDTTIVWKEMASLPDGYYLGDAVTLNNEIYFVAGRTAKSKVPFLYKFNPHKNEWIKLANVPQATFNIALAAVNGKIYAIGGDLFKNTTREYNPDTNSWRILEPMPTGRQHIDCGVYKDEIYIMGGLTSWENITQKHEAYNVLTNSWTEKAAIPSLRNNAAVVTLDNLIYVIGGAGTEDDIWGDVWAVETYDVNSDKWEQKNNLPFLLFKPAATVVNGRLFVLGGQTMIDGKNDCSDKVLIYRPETDSWEETTPLPTKNVFLGCVTITNKIYVIGGTVGGNPDWEAYSAVYEGEVIND